MRSRYYLTFKSYRAGFSIMELMVVIAIIGILAAVGFRGFASSTRTARDNERITEITQVAVALELYFNACRQYPSTLTLGANNGNGPSNICPNSVTLNRFLNSIPIDPLNSGSNIYTYATNGGGNNHSAFVIRAVLERRNRALDDDVDLTVNGINCGASPEVSPDWFFCKGS